MFLLDSGDSFIIRATQISNDHFMNYCHPFSFTKACTYLTRNIWKVVKMYQNPDTFIQSLLKRILNYYDITAHE